MKYILGILLILGMVGCETAVNDNDFEVTAIYGANSRTGKKFAISIECVRGSDFYVLTDDSTYQIGGHYKLVKQ